MNEEQLRHELKQLQAENSKLKIQLNAFDAEYDKLKAKLKLYDKGPLRPVFDIDTLASYPALKNSLYSLQSYGPRGNDELLSKLGLIVRQGLFSDEKVATYRRPKGDDEKMLVDMVPMLRDLNNMQYRYYLTALDRVYGALSDTIVEYRNERERKETNT